MSRRHCVLPRLVSTLSAVLAACGGLDGPSLEPSSAGSPDAGLPDTVLATARVSDACQDAKDDDCYAKSGLLGTWKCVTDDITVSANGQLTLLSGDGQRAAGCLACDGTFQAESTPDSGGSPSNFSIVDGMLQSRDEESTTASWSYCNEVDNVDACSRAPEKGMDSARCYLVTATSTKTETETDAAVAPIPPGVAVEVLVTEMRTPTMIEVAKGASVTISGQGEIHWYTGVCDTCTSTPVGSGCPVDDMNFLVRGIRCWSLVAWIGETGKPFYVGESTTFTATESGMLYVAVNDDNFADNTGKWTAYIDVQPGS